MSGETGRLLSVAQCADRVGSSTAFFRKLLAKRVIPSHKIGRLTRIAERDLEALIRAGFRPPRAHGVVFAGDDDN